MTTIITKCWITTIFEIQTVNYSKTMRWINQVNTMLRFKRKSTELGIFHPNWSIFITTFFILISAMAEITISTKPPIICKLTIFILSTSNMYYWTLFEELFCLWKKWLTKIKNRFWRIGMFVPFILVPDRIRTFWTKNRNNFFPSFITLSLMQIPVRPKSSQMLNSLLWRNIGIWHIKERTEFRFKSGNHYRRGIMN